MNTTFEPENAISAMARSVSWDPYANFFVIFQDLPKNSTSIVMSILKEFWKHFVVNISIGIPYFMSSSEPAIRV